LFEAVNAGDAEPVLEAFAPAFEHCFIGNSALGGARHRIASTRNWYGRLYRLLPDIKFDLKRLAVNGGPWNTLVVIEWNETNSGTDGVRTYNSGIHVLNLAWGKVTRMVICPDTAVLNETLQRLARAGNAEAMAAPIKD
jgi:ketosteroid isomerase-like protein